MTNTVLACLQLLIRDHQLIGFVGLITQNIDGEEKIELGYRLDPAYWGKGYATEAAIAVSDYVFNQLPSAYLHY
ncbi:MAG: GNAT family N-acetyltransferase [Chlamydiales bacterium]|nr:GNAT family N-acetyltransferase [Chlamydiales bacterium]